MTFAVQVCTIGLIISMWIVYHKQLYIKTESNARFEYMIYLLLSVSVSNVLIYILGSTRSQLCQVLTLILCRCFCILGVIYAFSVRDYIFYWLRIKNVKLSQVVRIVIAGILAFLPSSVTIDGMNLNISGVGMFVTIDAIGALTVYVLIVCFMNRAYMSKGLKTSILAWLVMLCLAGVVNMAVSMDLLSFACAMGALWLFYTLENPKAKIDDASGFFTSYVILDYLDSLPSQYAHVGIICTRDEQLDIDLLKALLKNTRIFCFKDADSFYYLVSQDYDAIGSVLRRYREHYDVIMLTYKNATTDTISLLSNYVKQSVSGMKESTIREISQADIEKMTADNHVHLEIVSALMENRIETYIQPIYNMAEGCFTSGECLCRLKKRNGDMLSPGEFIPIAERTGLITEIETAMFRNMCKCLSDDKIKASHIKYLEANLSIKKGEQKELLSEYKDIISEFGVTSDKVNLEITETDIVEEKMSILDNMHAMRSMGFSFSLDDFGTGESNLGYIIDMPVSVIKFDREITQKAMHNERAFTIVANVMNMAHELGIKVVVEGVETQDDFNMCKKLQADYIQGYFFSKPLPMADFIKFIDTHNPPIEEEKII